MSTKATSDRHTLLKLRINTIKKIGTVTGISTLTLLCAIDRAHADTVNMLSSTTVTATGAGATGVPSITNFNIPAGRNRVILAIPMFERDHCAATTTANCSVNNTTGTGLGTNFARFEERSWFRSPCHALGTIFAFDRTGSGKLYKI